MAAELLDIHAEKSQTLPKHVYLPRVQRLFRYIFVIIANVTGDFRGVTPELYLRPRQNSFSYLVPEDTAFSPNIPKLQKRRGEQSYKMGSALRISQNIQFKLFKNHIKPLDY